MGNLERGDDSEPRWPGYLGRHYEQGRVLCLAHVARSADEDREAKRPVLRRTNREIAHACRAWRAAGRTPSTDRDFLEAIRRAYQAQLPETDRWKRHFRSLVEDHLGLDRTHVAWANFAKCRVPVDCERDVRPVMLACRPLYPVEDLVSAIRPRVVLSCVLDAADGGALVASWGSGHTRPLVFTWHGRTGKNLQGEPMREWAPRAGRQARESRPQSGTRPSL